MRRPRPLTKAGWGGADAVENVMINIQDATALGWSAAAELVGAKAAGSCFDPQR